MDDASSDCTAAIAREHGARVICVSHRQIAATRNTGASHATGAMFVFLDADTIVNEPVITAAIRAIDSRRGRRRLPGPFRRPAAALRPRLCGRDRSSLPGVAFGKWMFPLLLARGIPRDRRVRRGAVRRGGGGNEPSPPSPRSVRGPPRLRGHFGTEVPGLLCFRSHWPACAARAGCAANRYGGGKVWSSGTGNGGATLIRSLDRPRSRYIVEP